MRTQDLLAFRETNMGNDFLNSDGNCNEMELNNFSALDASIQQQFTPDNDEESSFGGFGGINSLIQRQKEAQVAAVKAAADSAASAASAAVTVAAIEANQSNPRLIKSVIAAQTSDAVMPTIQNAVVDTSIPRPMSPEALAALKEKEASVVPPSLIKIAPKPPAQSTEQVSKEKEVTTDSTTKDSTSTTPSQKKYMGMSKNTGLIVLGVFALGVGAFVYFKYIKK